MSTKILTTLGPSSLNEEVIKALSRQGVSLFRINLSHTPVDQIASTIDFIQQYTDVPICLDSEGAQIRNSSMKDGRVVFQKGRTVKIHYTTVLGDESNISFSPDCIARTFEVGDTINIDFQSMKLKIVEKTDAHVLAEVEEGGAIGSNKAADLQREIAMEPLSEKDKTAVEIGRAKGVKFYALSFASSQADVMAMRDLISEDSTLIAKIENKKGLLNLNDILESSDAILIDRGDLSRQIPIEKIPFLQRKIIAIAKYQKVPAYVATNLLESMVEMRLPTRAEVNDVASTLLMGADGLVLAAETAIGKFPIETVEMVNKLVDEFSRWTPHTNIDEIICDQISESLI